MDRSRNPIPESSDEELRPDPPRAAPAAPANDSQSSEDELIDDTEYNKGVKRIHAPDSDDENWNDLVIFTGQGSYLTDEHRLVSDAGSFQFCRDLEGGIVNIDEVHTPQSTLALLENQEVYVARSPKTPQCETSSRLGLAQESDDELLFLEACFQAQGLKGPQAKAG